MRTALGPTRVFHAVGGLLRHGGALTAIACSTVNSYNGLVPRVGGFEGGTVTWAPTHMTYGYNNRSAMLRLPQSQVLHREPGRGHVHEPLSGARHDRRGHDRRRGQ